jgi:hypothetical protein
MSRKFTAATLVAAIAAVAFLVLSSTVGARPMDMDAAQGSANNPRADIQENNSACGADLPALRVIGFVNYHRTGNIVKVNWHFRDAMPNFTYQIQLWRDACTFHAVLGTITTNQNGVGNLTASTTVPPTSTRFFATAFKPVPGFFDDTPAVILTP